MTQSSLYIQLINLCDLKARLGVGDELLDVVVLLLHVRAELLVLLVQPLHLGWRRVVKMLNLLLLLLLYLLLKDGVVALDLFLVHLKKSC